MQQLKTCVQCYVGIQIRAIKCPHCGVLQPELPQPVRWHTQRGQVITLGSSSGNTVKMTLPTVEYANV
jgi:hypothetical protein